MTLRLVVLALSLTTALGCGGGRRGSGPPGPLVDSGTPPSGCAMVAAGTQLCQGETLVTCGSGGTVASSVDCLIMGQQCSPDLGCVTCRPGSRSCSGNASQLCRTDGSGYDAPEPCTGSLSCDVATGVCVDLCSVAASSSSYIGCEYWPTPVTNGVAPEFDFAVVVTNPQVVQAQVSVSRGGSPITSVTVAPGAVQTLRLPWITALKDPSRPRGTTGDVEYMSAQVANGAYKLTSTVPVTVYQFNPLEYRITRDCADEPPGMERDGQCFSFTNDASLLLPATVLTGDYMVMSWPTMYLRRALFDTTTRMPLIDPATGSPYIFWSATPGYVAIVNVETTPVTVGITFTAQTQASTDRRVAGYRPGQTGNFTLQPGEVLQIVSAEPPQTLAGCPSSSFSERQPFDCGPLTPCEVEVTYCDVGTDYDLTGSRITASGRVAVLSGHQCTFVPQHRWACDHLEEMMFPIESWGRDFLVSATQPLRSEPNIVRIVSGADGNTITFNPVSVHAGGTLSAGQMIEFETSQDFQVTGSQALLVGQFLVGQDYAGPATSGPMGNGDPALSLAVPTEQFRTSYAFLAPSTYEISYVNITARQGQTVLLDGAPVTGWRPVGGTGMQTARVMVSGGAHAVTSGTAFGIVVYGFGSYTSYMYPGGLDFETINLI